MTSSNLFSDRLHRLQARMAEAGVDLVAIAPTANMRYLLGFMSFADERPCALLVTRDATRLVVPELNADQMEVRTHMATLRWSDADGPRRAFAQALDELNLRPGPFLVADNSMRADALLLLQDLVRPGESLPAGEIMARLRMRKSEGELEALARAAAQADQVLLAAADACRPGVSEREVAEKTAASFRSQGAEAVDFTIVGSGPNGAFPHHQFSDRRLEPGDMIVIDIGATLDGYHSDVTRMVHLGEPTADERAVFGIVLEALTRGREAAVPGARARDVDRAARQVIEKAGYGPSFVHRTGHGIGLEGHEPPWITGESEVALEPGMVFSVEPGIYLQGQFGVRLEDIVVITDGSCRSLTGLDHAMIVKD